MTTGNASPNVGRATKPSFNFGGTTGTVNYDPGVPFGTYDICADAVVGGATRRATLNGVAVTQPTGNPLTGSPAATPTITITSSSTAAACS
jgi:hypothetical protein